MASFFFLHCSQYIGSSIGLLYNAIICDAVKLLINVVYFIVKLCIDKLHTFQFNRLHMYIICRNPLTLTNRLRPSLEGDTITHSKPKNIEKFCLRVARLLLKWNSKKSPLKAAHSRDKSEQTFLEIHSPDADTGNRHETYRIYIFCAF